MKKYFGIDIGGTSAKFARIDQNGKLTDIGSFATYRDMEQGDFLNKIYRLCDNAKKDGIKGIGISTLGVIDTIDEKYVGGVQNLPFLLGLSLKKRLESRYPGLPISVINDAWAVALAELWMGEGKKCDSFVCITLGTGIGGAIVIDGKLVKGFNNRSGEIGFSDYKSENDYFEKNYSTNSVMSKVSMKMKEKIDGLQFFNKCRAGEKAYLAELEIWMAGLAGFVSNCCLIIDPEKVILGGGVSAEHDFIIPILKRYLNAKLPPEFQDQVLIVPASNTNNAGIIGAVAEFVL